MTMIAKHLAAKLIDDENLPATVGVVVSAASGTLAGMAIMETIQMSVQILAVLCSMAVSIFTIRYLIIKTKNLNK